MYRSTPRSFALFAPARDSRPIALVVGAAALALAFMPQAQARQCATGGAGGAVPVTGSGDGTWPSTLPSAPLVASLAVSVPGGATVLKSVRLNGLNHTWIGDLHFVLQSPSGQRYTVLHRPGFTGAGFGCEGDVGGNYVIVDVNAAVTGSCGANGLTCTASIPPGTYRQTFDAWPSGTNGINNTPLESIPISSGVWSLSIYDWAGGDVGSLSSWDLCFGSPSSAATGFPPTITIEPQSSTVCAGSTASVSVTATATPAPNYQWFWNGTPLPGTNTSTLSFASVTPAYAGTYSVWVSNSCGLTGSADAVLTINTGPTITMQPQSHTVCVGDSVSFSVAANGSPSPTYQWRKNGAPIAGATSSSFGIASVAAGDTASYSCAVSNSCGSVISSSANLTIDVSDSDGDGTPDCSDGCPNDANKITPGVCGCGLSDVDSDTDGSPDCVDGCPSDPAKVAPGACGCGVADGDTDGDGTADCIDGCPDDPSKIAPTLAPTEIPHIVSLSNVPYSSGNGTIFTGLVCRMGMDTGGACFPGYPNNVSLLAFKSFTVSYGDHLSYDFRCDSAPGTDVVSVMLVTTGVCPVLQCDCAYAFTSAPNERITLATYSGALEGNDNIDLSSYAGQPVCIVVNAVADAAGSDADCGYDSLDGLFEFDNIRVGADLTTFENGANGWTFGALSTPGHCGCGAPDIDSDGDGFADCNDGCPFDALKIAPGHCGCGVADADFDGDSVFDCIDNCTSLANPGQEDCDGDGIGDVCEIAAGTQLDINGNMIPDDCEPSPVTSYCTAGTTTNGCNPAMSAIGTPSISASSGFVLVASNVEGQKQGLIFYGINGPIAVPWGSGSSYLCVKSPTQRTPVQSSGGTVGACDGVLASDWLAFLAANPGALGSPFGAGTNVWAQAWFRDPPSPKTTNLSNGLMFVTQP